MLLCPGTEPSSPTSDTTQNPEDILSTQTDLPTMLPVWSTTMPNTSKCSALWALPPPNTSGFGLPGASAVGPGAPLLLLCSQYGGSDALWDVWFAVQVEGCSPDSV